MLRPRPFGLLTGAAVFRCNARRVCVGRAGVVHVYQLAAGTAHPDSYRKAGLRNRAELSAFFLEDLLLPGQAHLASDRT